MAPATKGGAKFDPVAVEQVEWRAQRDLGARVPAAEPTDADGARASDGEPSGGEAAWGLGGFDPPGRWRRWLRDGHPPRFRVPGDVAITVVEAGDTGSFAATAAFGLHLPARAEAGFATLPGKPGWRCYLTSVGESPAALATFADGPIVLIALDATAEAGRRSPAHMALLHRAISDATRGGAGVIGARLDEESGEREAAAPLLLAGFEKAYRCPSWVDAGLPAS
ncbi:MAG: hypothetical protein J0H06_10270 [Actinobacteria bacterium]|nr:hypothetical protein [Actinomycetota bacterium]OJU84094.1 MAG: hypothetical protein BGO11_11695 [Solirubrobacterales bacterium 70-9]